MIYVRISQDELYHYGVKGMKWGVRKDPQVQNARYTYKQSKKQYKRDFGAWYNKNISAYSPIKKHRHNNDIRYQKALVSAGDMGIKKGKYMQAKGVAKNNKKLVNKGKYYAARASRAKKYNNMLLTDLNKGMTYGEARKNNQDAFVKLVEQQRKATAKYKKEKRGY